MGPILKRNDSPLPFQTWRAFAAQEIVQVWNAYGDSRVGPASDFWWGYEQEMGCTSDGVIIRARRLCRPRSALSQRGG